MYILITKKNSPEEAEYRFLSLYAYDSYNPDENSSLTNSEFRHMNEDLYYELTNNGNGIYTITIVVPKEYLTHPDLVYPVTIDPTITRISNDTNTHDTFVSAATPNTQSNSALDYIRFGKVNGYKVFGYHRFDYLPPLPAGTHITSAYLKFTFRNGQNTPTASSGIKMRTSKITNHQWYESSITWNNQPYGSTGPITNFTYNGNYIDYVNANVTDMVRSWYSGMSQNYGIYFTYSNEEYNDYNSVVSSEGDAARAPTLTIGFQSSGFSSGEQFYLRNVKSGKYLTVPNSSSNNGTDLVQYSFQGSTAQQFRIIHDSTTLDSYLVPLCAPNSGVEITNASSLDNEIVQIWEIPSTGIMNSQRFKVVRNSDQTYTLLSYTSSYTKAIVVKNASTTNNAAIIQYTNDNSNSMKWYLEPAKKTVSTNTTASVNSDYNRTAAVAYASAYAVTPNNNYEYFSVGGDCTNFVSQCLLAGGLSSVPTTPTWMITNKESVNHWFYMSGPLDNYSDDWVSNSFVSASAFNAHWGQSNMRAYQTIEYATCSDATEDIEFLLRYLKKGDILQLKMPDGGNFYHSMIIYNDSAICDGLQYGEDECSHLGEKEIIYAQHTRDTKSGHLRTLLEDYETHPIIIIKIKNDE